MASGSSQPNQVVSASGSSRSIVWKYFTKENPKLVKCKVCNKHLRYNSSTTAMRQHLDRLHPLVLSMAGDSTSPTDMMADNSILNLPSTSRSPLPIPKSTVRHRPDHKDDTLTEAICSYIIEDMMPVSTVGGVGFQRLIEVLAPSYKVPSVQYFEDLLHTKYLNSREKLKTLVKDASCVAVSCYTMTGTYSALVVMVHLVGNNVESYVLSTCEIKDEAERKAEDLVQLVLDCLSEYDLDEGKIIAVVHDNSMMMREAMDLLQEAMNCEPLICMGVLLNKCIDSVLAFPNVSETIDAARCVAAYLKPLFSAVDGKSTEDIKQDLTHHWTSIFEMSKSLIGYQHMIPAVIEKDTDAPCLTDQQWETLHAVVNVLSPLAGAVQVISQEQFVPVSSMRAILHSMEKKLEVGDDDQVSSVCKLKETIHASMKEQFQLEVKHQKPSLSIIAAALDPRHKTLKYHTSAQQNQMQASLREVVEDHQQRMASDTVEVEIETAEQPAKRHKSGMSDLLGSDSEDSDEESQQHSHVDNEILAYTCDKVISKETDPIEWWRLNESRYPTLAGAAKGYLCIPCTAALPADAFTKKQIIMPGNASPLNPNLLESLMFLHHNNKLVTPS